MKQSSFAQVSIDEGAAILNRVFTGYLVPIAFSSAQLQLHMSYNDVNAGLSPVWYDDMGEVIAAALLAARGNRGWVGGFGVAPEYRGRGYAKALVDRLASNAWDHDLHSISLEVLAENAPAIGLYRSTGFHITRRLFCFETLIEDARLPRQFSYASPDDLIDAPQDVRPCWQRESASLRNGAVSTAVVGSDGMYALFRHHAGLAQVFKLQAASVEHLTAIAHAVSAGEPLQNVTVLNEPEESPLVRIAHEAGWNEPFLQYEMCLQVTPSERVRNAGAIRLS